MYRRTLLLVRRKHDGHTIVALDSVGAGTGEDVYVCRGREASFAFSPDDVPSDATVVGIVDAVDATEVIEAVEAIDGDTEAGR